jgi:hypothetical protein
LIGGIGKIARNQSINGTSLQKPGGGCGDFKMEAALPEVEDLEEIYLVRPLPATVSAVRN